MRTMALTHTYHILLPTLVPTVVDNELCAELPSLLY